VRYHNRLSLKHLLTAPLFSKFWKNKCYWVSFESSANHWFQFSLHRFQALSRRKSALDVFEMKLTHGAASENNLFLVIKNCKKSKGRCFARFVVFVICFHYVTNHAEFVSREMYFWSLLAFFQLYFHILFIFYIRAC